MASGREPVRDWLKSLSSVEMKTVGIEVMYVQFKWPLGKPKVDHIDGPIWEVRVSLENRIARVLFGVDGNLMILLHGFIKKTQKTPPADIKIAKDRWKEWSNYEKK